MGGMSRLGRLTLLDPAPAPLQESPRRTMPSSAPLTTSSTTTAATCPSLLLTSLSSHTSTSLAGSKLGAFASLLGKIVSPCLHVCTLISLHAQLHVIALLR